MTKRVDDISMPWRIPFLAASYSLAFLCFVFFNIIHASCRIVVRGADRLDPEKNYIFCFWHTHWWPYFVVNARFDRPHVWINHPKWFMKPIHVAVRWMGVHRIILGSEGEEGRIASDELAAQLSSGNYSTAISPDGPGGPNRYFRKGVLHVAKKSGVPIVVVRIEVGRAITFKAWDRKKFPFPFSTIVVIYEHPVVITDENFVWATETIPRLMSGEDIA
jgi:lysophospholipid acyltransferase (LPLAT)-like uncharacterized protein